jgi:hypothetical protein
MKRAVFRGAAIAAVAVGWATGCMPESLEVGRAVVDAGAGDDGEGDGGTGSSDGGTGSSDGGTSLGGTTGHSGSSSAGRGASGGRKGEASGGAGTTSAGDGGSSPGGTGAGGAGGTGGTGGTGGDPRIRFDPECDCTAVILDDWGEFSCTVLPALFDAHFDPPESCELDESHAQKWSCDDGTDHYDWAVGGETDYEMVFVGETLVYGTASGYDLEEVCHFSYTDPDVFGGLGTLRAGTEPEADCAEPCAICETGDTDLARCPACMTLPDSPQTVAQSLEEYCAHRDCPPTLADARAELANQCPPPSEFNWMVIHRGCGLVRIDGSFGLSGFAYYYDETSGVLVGASAHNDVLWGECKVAAYRGGDIPVEACSETTTCDLCKPQDGAAGGEGGGGTSSGYEPCPP